MKKNNNKEKEENEIKKEMSHEKTEGASLASPKAANEIRR